MLGKKIIGGFFCALFLLGNIAVAATWEQVPQRTAGKAVLQEIGEGKRDELQLYATSAVLMDAASGRILYGKNQDAPMAMASTTKIMTCITVLENVEDLGEMVTVSPYASTMPKVKLYIKAGEQYQVRELLFSLMLESHNDAAVALAEHVGKEYLSRELKEKNTADFTVEESKRAVAAFAKLMNEKAAELGCTDTHFITPNGLDATESITLEDGTVMEKEHHTTAGELARMMSYCILESPMRDVFLEITGTPSYSFTQNGRSFYCNNHNAFLSMMEGAFSGKTGFTNKAGYCYVGALERDGRTFVVALLACGWPNHKSYKWNDTKVLMNYGVENYFYRELTEGKEEFIQKHTQAIPVADGQTGLLGETAYVEVEKKEGASGLAGLLMAEEEEITVELKQKKELAAPVEKGCVVGSIVYKVGDRVYRTEELVTKSSVDVISPKWCLEQVLKRFLLCD